jgi:hypothetical protein
MASEPTGNPRGYTDEHALLGDIGIYGYGSLVDAVLELVPELVWPRSVETYTRMRHDPQISAILKAYNLAAMRAKWSVDGAGCRDEVVAQTADDLGLPIKGVDPEPTGARRRAFTFAKHLPLALLSLPIGHMFFEQSWVEQGGRWRLATVQERMPQTIADIHLDGNGVIAWAEQYAWTLQRDQPKITTADHRLVYYVNEREGSNYFGRSVLRPSFTPWLIKGEVLRVHATSIRKFGMGVPYAETPPGYTPEQIGEVTRMLAMQKATEHMAASVPAGVKLHLAGLQGSVPDALGFLNYLDRQMTRSTLTSLLDMATAERGARSLGETVMDLMVYAQQAVAEWVADESTSQIVVPLVDANWGEDEPAPRIVVGDVGADLELTAQDVMWLTEYGAITNDPELESFLRGRYGIPDIDPKYVVTPEDAKAIAAQARATLRERPLGHLIAPTKPGGDE